MFCPNCGTKNEDDAVFCANCGTSLAQDQAQGTQESAEVQPQVEATQPVQEQAQPQPQMDNQAQFNGQPQMQFNAQPQMNGQMPTQPQAPKKPFKLTKKMISIGAAVLAVIVAVIIFVCVGNAGSDYKKTAKKYAQAVLKCDWDSAYSMVNFPESEFLTKEAYKTVNKDATPKATASISVTDDLYSSLGLSGQATAAVGKDVSVVYSTPGSSQSTMDLHMDVTPKKYMLFFKQYKVSSDSLVSKDTTFRVPVGSKLFINGVEVNASYKTSDSSSSSKSTDTYKIPFLFDGANTIKVTGDLFEDYEDTYSVNYDNDSYSVSTSKLKVKSDMMNAAQTQAETDLKAIADACVANKDVSSINARIYSSALTTVKKYYKYALQDCHTSSKNVSELKLSNIKATVKSDNLSIDSEDGYPIITVTLSYTKEGSYKYSPSDTAKTGKGTESSDSIKYKYVDGTWMICGLNIDLYIS